MQPPHTPWASITKPSSLPRVYGGMNKRQTKKQARQKIDCARFVASPGEAQDN